MDMGNNSQTVSETQTHYTHTLVPTASHFRCNLLFGLKQSLPASIYRIDLTIPDMQRMLEL